MIQIVKPLSLIVFSLMFLANIVLGSNHIDYCKLESSQLKSKSSSSNPSIDSSLEHSDSNELSEHETSMCQSFGSEHKDEKEDKENNRYI